VLPAFLFALQAAGAVPVSDGHTRRSPAPSTAPAVASARASTATRAAKAPVLDGRDDDDIWRTAQPITGFRQFDPVEDGEPPLPSEAKVAYDDRYIYVFVRAFDPHPDSIRAILSRRDTWTVSDRIWVMIDSYHDRRTGYEFGVNPVGVKFDMAISNDGNEDDSWDGVWDVATRIDDKGWTAEYRIPLSQLRFPKADTHTFGFSIWRDIARSNVRTSWPVWRRTKPGMVSQFGEISGFDGIGAPRRLEVTPYTVAKDLGAINENNTPGRTQLMTAGADIKYGLTSNLTVDATVNPDFGQVEADPSVLNLTAFETYYQERRPFFLEGAGIFSFDLDCNDGRCSGLFYSRRLGRAPQLYDYYANASTKQNTNIVAAAKLTGRLANGLSVGVLDAATERVSGPLNQTVEPRTNYFVGRFTQDFRNGNSGVGVMLTATNRQNDVWSRDYLRSAAYAVGVNARHKFWDNNYEVSGNLVVSRVEGTAAAIDSTQQDAVHYYQRPDGNLGFDTTRTSLDGSTLSVGLSKNGGGITRFYSGLKRTSPGFEINDAGFLSRADQQSYSNWFQLAYNKPTSWYRKAFVNFNEWTNWNTGGLLTDFGGNINAHAQFTNQWWGHIGYNLNNLGAVYDDRAARGGPALRRLFGRSFWAGLEADQRWRVAPGVFFNGKFRDASGSWNFGIDQSTNIRVSDRLQASIGASFWRGVDDAQWNGNFAAPDGITHYTFARLDQKLVSATTRLNFTATPTLSLQVYASPFLTSGKYTDWRELNDPRAANYADRFKPYVSPAQGSDPGGFNFKQFRSNTVVRWEYRPGSTLFLVWAQGRTLDGVDIGSFSLGRDAGNLFRVPPDNTFLVKTSYWFNW
jgi:hypothetical protein